MKSSESPNLEGFKKNFQTFFMMVCMHYVVITSKTGKPMSEMKGLLSRIQSIYRFYRTHSERAREELYAILYHMEESDQKKMFGGDAKIYSREDLSNIDAVMLKIVNRVARKPHIKSFDEYRALIKSCFSKNLAGRKHLQMDEVKVARLFDSLAMNYYKPSNASKSPHTIFVNNLAIMSLAKPTNANASVEYGHSQAILKAMIDPKFYLRESTGLHSLMRQRENQLKKELRSSNVGLPEEDVGRVTRNLGFEFNRILQDKVFSHKLLSKIPNMIRSFAKMQYVFLILHGCVNRAKNTSAKPSNGRPAAAPAPAPAK